MFKNKPIDLNFSVIRSINPVLSKILYSNRLLTISNDRLSDLSYQGYGLLVLPFSKLERVELGSVSDLFFFLCKDL